MNKGVGTYKLIEGDCVESPEEIIAAEKVRLSKRKNGSPEGHLTAKGYLRGYRDGRLRLMHNWVWEQHYGPIPNGFQVHHINEDKKDNRIENLELLTPTDHKRTHSPHYRRNRDNEWERVCSICQEWFIASKDNFYTSKQGWILYGRCRPCHIKKVVVEKRNRNAIKQKEVINND